MAIARRIHTIAAPGRTFPLEQALEVLALLHRPHPPGTFALIPGPAAPR